MPDNTKQYYVQVPGATKGMYIDSESYNQKRDDFFQKFPEAQVLEVGNYVPGESEIDKNSQYEIYVDGMSKPQYISGEQFATGAEDFMKKYPKAKIRSLRQDNYYGDKLTEIYDQMGQIDEKLAGLPEEEPIEPGVIQGGSLNEMQDIMRERRESPAAKERRELSRQKQQLLEARDANPAWRRYWTNFVADADSNIEHLEQMKKEAKDRIKGGDDVSLLDPEIIDVTIKMLKDAKEIAQAPSKYGGENNLGRYLLEYGKGAADMGFDAVSLINMAKMLPRGVHLVDALQELQNKYGKDADISDLIKNHRDELTLSDPQKEMVNAFVTLAEAQQGRSDNISNAYKAGQSFAQSLGFMADFYMAGNSLFGKEGVQAAGPLVKKTAEGSLARLGAETLEGAAKAVLMTPLMPSTYNNFIDSMLQMNEKGAVDLSGRAVLTAAGDALIENISETVGSKPLELLGWGLGKVPVWQALGQTKLGQVGKALRHSPIYNSMKQAGWHGLVEEMFEEVTGNYLRYITGVDKKAFSEFFKGDEFFTTLASFAPMSILTGIPSTARFIRTSNKMVDSQEELKRVLQESGMSREDMDEFFAAINEAKTPEEIGKILSDMTSVAVYNGATPSDVVLAAQQYAKDASEYKVLEGIMSEQQDIERTRVALALDESLGRTDWNHEGEGGGRYVRTFTDGDGNKFYYLSGGDGGVIAAGEDGKPKFISQEDIESGGYQDSGEIPVNEFLDGTVQRQKASAEISRMQAEKQAATQELRKKAAPGTVVNIGTREAPRNGIVREIRGGNYIVEETDEKGNVIGVEALTPEQMAEKLDMPMEVKTDQQLTDEEVAQMKKVDEQRKKVNAVSSGISLDGFSNAIPAGSALGKVIQKDDGSLVLSYFDAEGNRHLYEMSDSELDELAQRADQVVMTPVEEKVEDKENDGVPRDANGVAMELSPEDELDLWNRNPRAWAKWNDERRGGDIKNSVDYIQLGINTVNARLAELADIYSKATEPKERHAIESEQAELTQRLGELTSLMGEYQARVEAAAAAVKQEAEAEKVAEKEAELAAEAPAQQEELVLDPNEVEGLWRDREETKEADKGKQGRQEVLNAIYEANPKLVQFRNEKDRLNAVADVVDMARRYPDLEISKRILSMLKPAPARAEQNAETKLTPEQKEAQRQQALIDRANELSERLGVPVTICHNEDEVPDTEKGAKKQIKKTRTSRMRVFGWYSITADRVFIYLPSNRTISDIDKTFFHEVVAHKGLRELLAGRDENGKILRDERGRILDNSRFNQLMRRVWNEVMTEEERREAMKQAKLNPSGATDEELQLIAADEYIATLAENMDINPTAWEKFVSMIYDLLNEIFDINRTLTKEDLSRLLRSSLARYESMTNAPNQVDNIDRAISEAIGGEIQVGEGNADQTRMSIRAITEGAGFEVLEDDGDGNMAIRTSDGSVFNGKTPVTAEDLKGLGGSVMSFMMNDARKAGTIDERQEERIWQSYADMLNAILVNGLEENGGAAHVQAMWEWDVENTVFKSVSANSDDQYKYSIDITRVCKKNEAVIKAISAMQSRLGYGITPGQVMDIYLSGIEEGYQVPCPVCYVFSRYIGNGQYATIAINGQRKYGDQLVDPSTLTEDQQKAKIDYWVKELQRQEALNETNKKAIAQAKRDVKRIIYEINTISDQITRGKLTGAEKAAAERHVHLLDKQYRAAFEVVSQANLSQWIKNFAIKEKKGGYKGYELYADTFQGFPDEYALDLRLTDETIKKYPGIQRLRKSGGAAAGKEIHFASNNNLGEVPMMVGASNLGSARNYYLLAARESDPNKRAEYLEKAEERFANARTYAQQQSLRGGQRMWSWSDNIERLGPDVFINLMQMQMLGGAVQAYSKQLEGINLVASMGGYVNGSLMGYGKGYQALGEEDIETVDGKEVLSHDIKDTVREKDENGWHERERLLARKGDQVHTTKDGEKIVLLFDDVVGIDAFGREEDGKHKKGLFDLNAILDKAGNIIVGMNDNHTLASMADDRIFFIIPWHSSGASVHILRQMFEYLGVDTMVKDFTDYTDVQEEKTIGEDRKTTPELVAFWDVHKNETDFACGIKGGIESGDGNGGLSAGQKLYRELHSAIFTDPTLDSDRERMKMIRADEFLSQTWNAVRSRVGTKRMTEGDKGFIYPYEYWDTSSTFENADVNGARYLEYCRRLGVKPKFTGKLDGSAKDHGNFADDKGYWKLLIDRRMYDVNGNFQDLDPISTGYASESQPGFSPDMVNPEWTGENFHTTKVADDPGAERMADRAIAAEEKTFRGKIPTVNYSGNLTKAVGNYQRVMDEVAEEEKAAKAAAKKGQKIYDKLMLRMAETETELPAEQEAPSAEDELKTDGHSYGNKALLEKYGLEAADLTRRGDVVTLNRLVAKERKQGAGTRFMQDLAAMADRNGWSLALTPTTAFGASSVGRLNKFYKRFGFKDNKGTNTDFSISESMIRRPANETMNQVRLRISNADERVFISNAEAALGKIKMERATPEQWLKMLEKEGGLKAAEDKWLGLSDWLKLQSDRKSIGKEEIAEYIAKNQIIIEEQKYAEDVEKSDEVALQSYQDEFDSIYNGMVDEDSELAVPREPYLIAQDAFNEMVERYGDDFSMAFEFQENGDGFILEPQYDWNDEPTEAARYFLDQLRENSDVRRINSTRKGYTTEGLRNLQEIALTVPTIDPWNEGDIIHFGDAGEGRAIAWVRFGDSWTSEAKDEAEKVYREAQKKFQDYRDEIVAKYALQATGTKTTRDLATDEENKKVRDLQLKASELYQEWMYGSHKREKVLVIDEIQSKRHQEAREQGGYKDDTLLKQAVANRDAAKKAYDDYHNALLDKYGNFNEMRDKITPEENEESNRLYQEFRRYENAVARYGFDPQADEVYRDLMATMQEVENNPERKRIIQQWNDALTDVRAVEEEERDTLKWALMSREEQALKAKEANAARNRLQAASDALKPYNEQNRQLQQMLDERERELIRAYNEQHKSNIPAAPFEKNWHELALKRMLRYAAEMGYDSIAWTTGDQQAERYNIGNYVSSIDRTESDEGERSFGLYLGDADGATEVVTDEEGNVIRAESHLSQAVGKPLSELVGKEVAVKMMQMEVDDVLEDVDLKIGNEGMRGFYDDILPRFMNKYGKKWNARVEDIALPALGSSDEFARSGEKGLTMHSVKVTPEMRESVMQGQLMFRMAEYEDYKEAVDSVDPQALRVFHGSGADFERFDHSHMSEGEGNQAYGWGTYVASNKDVANDYAVRFGEPGNRHLYTVEIPADNGHNYIHWDKPITRKQSNDIMDAVRKLADKDAWGDEFEYELKSTLGYGTLGRYVEGGLDYFLGNEMNYATEENPGAERNAKLLSSLGIVGIEIPMERGGVLPGSDYVIFNEDDLHIVDNLRFRITPEQDKEYLDAVENLGGHIGNIYEAPGDISFIPGENEDHKKVYDMVRDAAAIAMPNTKVVDKDGKPMVVYHGTPDKVFTKFAKPGEDNQGLIWMTDQKRYARVYAVSDNGEGGVYALFANIENPIDLGYIEDVVGSEAWDKIAEQLGMTPKELFDRVNPFPRTSYAEAQERMSYIYDYTRDANFANLLKEKGYDGAFAQEEGINKTPTFAAVDPSQVKSAAPVTYDDNGNVIPLSKRFNQENEDIRFRFDEKNTNFVNNGKGFERNQTADRENGSGVSEDKAERVSLRRDRSYIQVLEPEPSAIRRYDSGDSESNLQRRIAREQESQRLIETAKKNGLYIDPDKWDTFGVHKPGNTMESEIYADIDNGRYVKFKDPFASESMTGNDPSDAIYQHLIHNIFFPEARYKFIGISEKNGDVRIVLAQDFVNSDRVATTEQSKSYLTNRGFSTVNDYQFENDDIVVTDLEEENLLIGDDDSYHPIDPIISNKKPAREIIDKYIGGDNPENPNTPGENLSENTIDKARAEVDTNPTDAQKEAGNYKHGHLTIDGFDISLENPKGSVRSGKDADGNEWHTTMHNDYGYIRMTEGVDGDHLDVFLSDNPNEGNVYVVDQVDPKTGEFDEHKVMYGFNSLEEAREAYLSNYSEGWQGLGTITGVTKDEFKKWVESSTRKTKPFSEYKSVNAEEAQNEAHDDGEGGTLFRMVEDPAKIEELEAGEKEVGYRNVVMNEDGTLGSPMAGKLGKKGEKSVETSGFTFDKWEEAEENPGMATEDGKINLIKPNGKGSVDGVDYNPYIHIRPNTLNKQFTQAWRRPELVYVETQYPASELTSGYKADKAKLSVGRHDWNGGELILSRYDKPVRVVPWEEVADAWVEEFKDSGVTFDIVPPAMLDILAERGVEILPPKKSAGKPAMDAYNEWKEEPVDTADTGEVDGIRFSLRGLGGAQNAEDQVALDNLDIAGEMEAAGKDSDTIWRATGWQRGADGMWRNEIPDAKQKEGIDLSSGTYKAEDILDAPELFASYPELKDYAVVIKKLPGNISASFNPKAKTLTIDPANSLAHPDGKFGPAVLSTNGVESVLHELQHAIQHIEGFAKGSSSTMEEKYYIRNAMGDSPEMAYFAWFFSRSNTKNTLTENGPKGLVDTIRKIDKSAFNDRDQQGLARVEEYLDNITDEEFKSLVKEAAKLVKQAKDAAKTNYHISAGEVEARNVEIRSHMSERVRRLAAPETSEDTNREDQIVRFRITPEQDAEYMDAVESGDMEKAQEMVNAAAEAAMPNSKVRGDDGKLLVVYHGTQSGDKTQDFNSFSDEKIQTGRTFGDGYYFTDSRELADKYAERVTRRVENGVDENLSPRVIPAFLNIENIIDVEAGLDLLKRIAEGHRKIWNETGRMEDGVVVRNIRDGYDIPADTYVVRKNKNIKSAEPVTYDADGNVIPLSQRFNAESDDIRFRVSEDMQAASDLVQQYEEQDGGEFPWMTERELMDKFQESIPYGADTEDLYAMVDKYNRLDEADFEEGRRDFSGSEKDEVFNEFLEALRKFSQGEGPRFRIAGEETVSYEESPEGMQESAKKTADACGIEVEFVPSLEANGKPLAGKWEDGKMSVCLGNCRDEEDAVKTVLHEGVGHNGLRRLFGNENMTAFLMDVFHKLPDAARSEIVMAATTKYGLNIAQATEEYLATKAEKVDFENQEERTFWQTVRDALRRMLSKVGIDVPLNEYDIRWLMWQSYNANKQDDILNEVKRQAVASRLGFSLRQQEDKGEAVRIARFREAEGKEVTSSARAYNFAARNVVQRLKESFVDQFTAVNNLIDAIEKATGKAAKAFEDVRYALNQQGSKALAKMNEWVAKYNIPMWDAIKAVMKEGDFKLADVERYVMLKHGLERNDVFAKRDAREVYKRIYDKAVADIKADESKTMEDKEYALKKEKEKYERHLEKINNGTDKYYLEFRENDYGGLTGLYSKFDSIDPQGKNETDEEFAARQKAARHPMYDSVAEMEEAAKNEVAAFENRADTSDLWKKINAATKDILQQQYEANIISRGQYDHVKGMFKYYVPLRGFSDTEAEDLFDYYNSDQRQVFTAPLQRAKGRTTQAESPFGFIAAAASSGIAQDMKNESKLALYYFIANRPNNGIVSVSETWYEKAGEDAEGKAIFEPVYPTFDENLSTEAAKKAYEEWEKGMEDKAKAGLAYKGKGKLDLSKMVVHINPKHESAHAIPFKLGGKDMFMFVNGSPRAAQAINGELNYDAEQNIITETLNQILRTMSALNTQLNPEFWISNFQRDALFAIMSTAVKEDKEYARAFRKNLLAARNVNKMKKAYEAGTIGDSEDETLYKEFVDNGGVTGYTVLYDNEYWEKRLDEYAGKEANVVSKAIDAFKAVSEFGEAIEQMTRFAAYKTSRQAGKGIEESVNDAKDLTVNFNRKGSGKAITLEEAKGLKKPNGKPLTKLEQYLVSFISNLSPYGRRFIMFFNASIQGLNAMYKLAKKNPKKTAAWVGGYMLTGMLNAALHALGDDDDDYLDIPDYERRNNLLLGGKGVFLKWALPQEARVFYGLGDAAVNHALGRSPNKNIVGEMLSSIGEVAPVDFPSGIGAFVPSVATPLWEIHQNKDYKGSRVYNDNKYYSEEERANIPAYRDALPNTPVAYKAISEALNFISGGDEYSAGAINVNPNKIEHLVEGYTGGAGTSVEKMLQFFENTIGGKFSVRDTPFLRRVLSLNDERYRNSHTTDLYYYYQEEAAKTAREIKEATRNADDKKLNQIYSSRDYEQMLIFDQYKGLIKYYNEELKLTDDEDERKTLMREQDAVRKEMIKEISEIGKNND